MIDMQGYIEKYNLNYNDTKREIKQAPIHNISMINSSMNQTQLNNNNNVINNNSNGNSNNNILPNINESSIIRNELNLDDDE